MIITCICVFDVTVITSSFDSIHSSHFKVIHYWHYTELVSVCLSIRLCAVCLSVHPSVCLSRIFHMLKQLLELYGILSNMLARGQQQSASHVATQGMRINTDLFDLVRVAWTVAILSCMVCRRTCSGRCSHCTMLLLVY